MRVSAIVAVCGIGLSTAATAQRPTLSANARAFVAVDAPVIALTHARVIDGTGAPARDDETILISDDKITGIGKTGAVNVPANARTIDLTGRTVIPGIVGLHDHMYYSSGVSGSMKLMPVSYPRLFLANGVTTIRTTGSVDPYQEMNIKALIGSGQTVGPEIVVTGPYLQGAPNLLNAMHPITSADEARRIVRYWSEEGVTWFKAYTTITRDQLGAAIDEAHKHGVKVTAHLCSVTYREAVALGIDHLEHGLFASTDYTPGKQPDRCPSSGTDSVYAALDVNSPEVRQTIDEMVKHHVGLTSTLAVYELSAPSRVPVDQRVLDALYPDVSKSVNDFYTKGRTANDSLWRRALKKGMEFERAFVTAGGLLGAGADPCCISAIAGYTDQRNYELLLEAGFTPEQAIQIMTSNGAKVLGFADRLGTITPGKQADLVILRGDPTRTPGDIRNVEMVYRQGIGYDSAKLIASTRGMVGIK